MPKHFEKRTDGEGKKFVMQVKVTDVGPRTVEQCDVDIQTFLDNIKQLKADKLAIIAAKASE